MAKKPDKQILDYKKNIFLKEVGKAAHSLGVSTPIVKFWSHYEDHFDAGERAHIHAEEGLICIAEPELERMSEEEIRTTATHEITHIYNIGHGMEFQEAHGNLELGSWEKPAGTMGALPEDYVPPKEKKERKQSPIKYRCNYHACNKKTKTKKCRHCGDYFCKDHIKSTEPLLGKAPRYRIIKDNTHPCFAYFHYLEKEKEKEDKEYQKALDGLSGKKTKKIENKGILDKSSKKKVRDSTKDFEEMDSEEIHQVSIRRLKKGGKKKRKRFFSKILNFLKND